MSGAGEVVNVSPWAWLTCLIPSFRRIPVRCAACNRELDPDVGFGPPKMSMCSGYAWVLHYDGRNLCFSCADEDRRAEMARAAEQAKRDGKPRAIVLNWRFSTVVMR